MPTASAKLCPRCRHQYRGQHCPTCQQRWRAAHDQQRPNSSDRGYGHHWRTTTRPAFLRDNPLCTLCGALAEVPDHYPLTRKTLLAMGVADPDAHHRLRPLCKPCHARHGPSGVQASHAAHKTNPDTPHGVTNPHEHEGE